MKTSEKRTTIISHGDFEAEIRVSEYNKVRVNIYSGLNKQGMRLTSGYSGSLYVRTSRDLRDLIKLLSEVEVKIRKITNS